ncbi:hypothetical protein [Mesobacterium pallidum]|uniref:portal protein n=1 Tax=Mesobacterium pallidum TaxID=2872037 RepID=UPI001EE32CE7|nr:hypothetical protein [Mesobacterium pallidum]
MFDPYDDPRAAHYSGHRSDDPSGRMEHNAPEPMDETMTPDEVRDERIWQRLMGHYAREIDIQAENRAQMAEDEDFYDGYQWRPEDAALLAERGQEAIVYPVIATTVNWVLGSELRARTDFKVLPRTEEGGKAAERKTELLKYLSDVNRTEFGVSDAFSDCAKTGLGWIEAGIQDEVRGEPIYAKRESWRNIIFDSLSTERDMSDARYVFRHKWVDTDIAKAFFRDPKAHANIDRAARSNTAFSGITDAFGDDYMDAAEEDAEYAGASAGIDFAGAGRERLRLIEGWYVRPEVRPVMRGGQFAGEVFDNASEGHRGEVIAGLATIKHTTVMRMFVMIFTTVGPIYHAESPYRHNAYPFTPIWGYRRGRNGQPYGMIRNLKGMQRDVNKRASKALAIMSSNRVIMEEGAVDDLDAFANEVGRPDAIIVTRPNKRLDLDSDRGLDTAHLNMMSATIALMQTASGVTDENLGRETNASSGKAIIARQDQGSLATSILFDNLRLARQIHGEKELSLIEQFMTEQKKFRITNQRGAPTYVTVNDGLPENDIIRTKADFIISESAWHATLRQAGVEQLLAMAKDIGPVEPRIITSLLDLIIESMDIPNRDEVVRRVRMLTGQIDPDADLKNPDPETAKLLQMQQAQAQAASEEREIALDMQKAEAAAKRAQAAAAESTASKNQAGLAATRLDAHQKAVDVAGEILAKRALVPVADRLLESAGFTMPPMPPMPPQPAMAPAPM